MAMATWSELTKEVLRLQQTWTIQNFSFFKERRVLHSSVFSADSYDTIKWKLSLYPDGDTEDNKGFISLYIHLVSCDKSHVLATCKLQLLDAAQGVIGRSRILGSHKFKEGDVDGFGEMAEGVEVFDHLQDSVSDDLCVCCDLLVAVPGRL